MPVYKDKKRNTWYAKIFQADAVTGKGKQILKRGFATKREALAWEVEQYENEAPTSATFTEMDNLYIQYKNPKKESTRKQETSRVQKYMSDFCQLPISDITKSTLMEWQTELTKREDIAVSTKNYCIGVVRSVFKLAHEFYGIPNSGVVLKKLKRKKKKEVFEVWTPEEFNQFIQYVEIQHYRNIYTFMYCTGLRRGEALALRAEDFDLQKGTVHVYHQIKYFHEGFIDLKTESSERTLKLPKNVLQFVKPIVEQRTAEYPFVFGWDRSLPITNLQRNFTKAIKASGVKKIRLHDLRHSFATNAIANGCNIVAVSHYLGHATIEQTLETYTHLLDKTDDEMAQKMYTVLLPVIHS